MSRPPLSTLPLLFPTLSLIAGILVARQLPGEWIVASLLLLLIAASLLLRKSSLTALTVISLTGYAVGSLNFERPQHISSGDGLVSLRGEVKSAAIVDRGQSVKLIVSQLAPVGDSILLPIRPFTLQVSIPDFAPEILCGEVIEFHGRIEPVVCPTDLPDEADFSSRLLDKSIYYRSYVPVEDITVVGEPHGFINAIKGVRNDAMDILFRSNLSPGAKKFLAAAILGDDEMLDSDTRQSFAQAGIAHILALSGLHVGIIALIISFALYPLRYVRGRKTALVITLIILWLYALATGLSPSVVRAVTMATLYSVARIFQRQQSPLNSLLFAAMLILLFSPGSLFTIGFQLSFAAVISIILFADRLNPIPKREHAAYLACSYITVTLSAMIGTSMISLLYFHSFPLYFLMGNVVTSLFLPFLIGGGILVILLGCFGFSLKLLVDAVDGIYNLIIFFSDIITSLPGATIDNICLPAWIILPYFATVAALLALLIYRNKTALALFSALFVTTAGIIIFYPNKPIEDKVYLTARTSRTDIIIPSKEELKIYTTANPTLYPDILRDGEERYSVYMGYRGIKSLRIIPADSLELPKRYLSVLHSDSCLYTLPDSCTYLVVARGFRASIQSITERCRIDTLILAADLGKPRLTRYSADAASLGIPHKSVKDHPIHLPY